MSAQYLAEFKEHTLAEVQVRSSAKIPRKYRVLLLNDDYTPMDFVVEVLKRFFHLEEEKAMQIMLQVHRQGSGVCGVFTRDIAETKVALVNDFARSNDHPLLCSMEPE